MPNSLFMKKKSWFAYMFRTFHGILSNVPADAVILEGDKTLSFSVSNERNLVRGACMLRPIRFQCIEVCISTGTHYTHKYSL